MPNSELSFSEKVAYRLGVATALHLRIFSRNTGTGFRASARAFDNNRLKRRGRGKQRTDICKGVNGIMAKGLSKATQLTTLG